MQEATQEIGIQRLVREVMHYRSCYGSTCSFTPFSMWGKGRHKKARTQLLQSLRALLSFTKKKPEFARLDKAARAYKEDLDNHRELSSGAELTASIDQVLG